MRRVSLGLLWLLSCAAPVAPRSLVPVVVTPLVDPRAVEEAALKRLVGARLERLRPCYRRELGLDSAFEHKMAIGLFVTDEGKVADMNLMDTVASLGGPRTTQLNDPMARCLGVEVMTWTFPPTTWVGQVEFVQPPAFIAWFSTKPIDPNGGQALTDEKGKIRNVIRGGNLEYKACYEAYLGRGGPTDQPTRVKVRIRIQNDGAVAEATVLDPTAAEPKLSDCLVGALRKLEFAKLRGDGIMIVDYPLVFEPIR